MKGGSSRNYSIEILNVEGEKGREGGRGAVRGGKRL
jgi:hypothetical protein